ncbi:MAG TPA: Holliday junction resolvase RuvX [Jatrophihabitantaceae bacterium]|nr:Holliday junction resolvase RuvX [Jatrophihabitantaceae bacterium]
MSAVTGVWLGVDVGTVRVGVARSDPRGVLASPVATLAREGGVRELARLVQDHEAVGVVVGLPVTLAGREGTSAALARDYAEQLARVISPIPVELVDERLTTVAAERRLAARGVRGRARRAVVDQAAAVEILQQWLNAQHAQSDGPV